MTSVALEEAILNALGAPDAPAAASATDVRVLDATLVLLGEHGERRLTMDDVAAKAKVARRTLFRRFGSKQELLERAYAREVRLAAEHLAATVDGIADVADALVAAHLWLVEYSTGHPVIRRLARAEPETLVELWRSGAPSGHEMARMLLRSVADRAEGRTVSGDLDRACELLAGSLLAEQLIPDDTRARGLRDPVALRRIVAAALEPSTERLPIDTTRSS